MHTARDRSVHGRHWRTWSPAFSDKVLRGYESRVQKYNDLPIKQIFAFSGTLVGRLGCRMQMYQP
jgi:hypothetical protein